VGAFGFHPSVQWPRDTVSAICHRSSEGEISKNDIQVGKKRRKRSRKIPMEDAKKESSAMKQGKAEGKNGH
jgi:hypothetical protein